jgi:hypothetical protein
VFLFFITVKSFIRLRPGNLLVGKRDHDDVPALLLRGVGVLGDEVVHLSGRGMNILAPWFHFVQKTFFSSSMMKGKSATRFD